MKAKRLILPLLLAMVASPLYAGHGHGQNKKHRGADNFVVKARVSHVEPIYEVIQIPSERRECWGEEVSGSHVSHSSDGMLVGAIIGGVIGHNVGQGHNRGATTAVGTLIGATIGHDSDRDYETPYRYTEQRCQITTDTIEEERISGYRVSYRFQGDTHVTQMERDPGRYVNLRVSLLPLHR